MIHICLYEIVGMRKIWLKLQTI